MLTLKAKNISIITPVPEIVIKRKIERSWSLSASTWNHCHSDSIHCHNDSDDDDDYFFYHYCHLSAFWVRIDSDVDRIIVVVGVIVMITVVNTLLPFLQIINLIQNCACFLFTFTKCHIDSSLKFSIIISCFRFFFFVKNFFNSLKIFIIF